MSDDNEKLGGADFVELKDGTKVIILGDVHHNFAEAMLRHLPMPVEHIAMIADGIINDRPRRSAMMRSFAEIYGKPAKIVADIYAEFETEKVPEKRGQAPNFIKERNQKHWRRR